MRAANSKLKSRLKKHVKELPVLPQALVNLMALDPDQDDIFDKLLKVIEPEPSYTARILSMANSVASGSAIELTTLKGALARIGGRGARDLVFALGVSRVFVPRDAWEKSLWRHALHVAIVAREFARRDKLREVDPEEAYVCGLLHDIGRFVLFQECPEDLRQIDEGGWKTPGGLLAKEISVCGISHTELGALACERWQLPALITETVRNHHRTPDPNSMGRDAKLVAVVHAADLAMFPTAMPGTAGLEEADDEALGKSMLKHIPPFVELNVPQLHDVLAAAAEEAHQAIGALGIE